MKVCHLSSVHKVNDIRVFRKECVTLAENGFDVTLVACRAGVNSGPVKIVQTDVPHSRLKRMFLHSYRVYRIAKAVNADVYHFHDPELLPYGLLLKRGRKCRVIYDSHECLIEDLVTKEWIPRPLRMPMTRILRVFENFVVDRLDAIVTATPHITERFRAAAPPVVNVNNFPLEGEFAVSTSGASDARENICYVGAISFIRGITQLLDSFDFIDPGIGLHLAGIFASEEVEAACKCHRNWPRVTFHGQVDREGVSQIYQKSFAGIVNFLPAPNHIHSQPNKLFEYMSAGIPVICSNFDLWRQVVEAGECGMCVDPMHPESIATAVNSLSKNTALQDRFAHNGRRLISERYTWETEGLKLVSLYEKLRNI